jgi:hypothetical protein
MRNKLFLCSAVLAIALAFGCSKGVTLPVSQPSIIFTASTLNHTADSVNVGDTIHLQVTGTMSDTTKTISAYLVTTFTAGGVSGVYNYGNSSSPVKLNRTILSNNGGLYSWTATIIMPGATNVPHKTALTVTATLEYQLSLSSELPTSLTLTDKGVKNKTIYVR